MCIRLSSVLSWALIVSGLAISFHTDAVAAELPDAACSAISRASYADTDDAATSIVRTSSTEDGGVSRCLVRGYVAPQITFALFLPENWNGRLIVAGIGGAAGVVMDSACEPYMDRGYACITSDFGHQAGPKDGLWALNNPLAQADLAYRAGHVLPLAARRIVADYFGRPPARTYYVGCSGGGTIGLTAAHRYPYDYDGILVGDPAVLVSDWAMQVEWANRRLRTPGNDPLFSPASLATLNRGALAACDARDGLVDGVISNPVNCRFDPAVMQCRPSRKSDCLSAEQVEAARAIYRGPRLEDGRFGPGALAWPGSELEWTALYDMRTYVADQFRYAVFGQSPGELTGDYLADIRRFGIGIFRDASNPDLRRYAARGGKVLAYLGAANGVAVSGSMLDYYRLVERTSGGETETQRFFRLFIVPGMNHCGGGVGAWRTDTLAALEDWVEKGKTPDRLLAWHLPASSPEAEWQFERPLYPYPYFPRYDGRGDRRSASSFKPARMVVEP